MLMLSALVFLAVILSLLAFHAFVSPSRTEARLKSLAPETEKSNWTANVVKAAGPLAKLSLPEGDWEHAPLRLKFFNAGIRSEDARVLYFAAKTMLPLLFAAAAYLLFGIHEKEMLQMLLYVVSAATIGCYLPNFVVHLMAKSRTREIFESFPDATDLMLVCVEAGMGLDAALVKVTDEIRMKSVPLAQELHMTSLEMRAGGTREKALRNLALRTGVPEVGTFAMMLTQADKFGTSIGESLRVFSDDLRHRRQARAEEKAAKIPTKMLFPLVTCIFPAIVMVILGPAVIQIIRTVLPSIAGTGS